MANFPWLLWIGSTIAIEVFLVWYVWRSQSAGVIERHRWPLKSERLLDRDEDEARFDRVINAWRMLMLVVPLVTFGLLYFGDY